MIAISGTKVSSIPTPAMSPLVTSPVTTGLATPRACSSAVAPSVTGPEKRESRRSCSGAATVVVIWKTAHMTAAKTSGPPIRLSTTRSSRSLAVRRTCADRTTARPTAASTQPKRSSAASKSSSPSGWDRGTGGVALSRSVTSAARRSEPMRRRGSRPTTGAPTASAKAAASTRTPRAAATSSMVKAMTTRTSISRSWPARYRLRVRWVASATTTTTSGRSHGGTSTISARVSSSSGDIASSEYAPGRSTRSYAGPLAPWGRQTPRPTSTVVPGQLPMVRRAPVRTLKRVDLPTLGAPARATTGEPLGATPAPASA